MKENKSLSPSPFSHLVLVIFFTLGMAATTVGQGLSSIPLSEFSLHLVHPDLVLNQNDSLTLEIHIGQPGEEVQGLSGFELLLTLGDAVESPELESIDLGHSWLGEGSELTNLSSMGARSHTIRLAALREDHSGKDGFGEIVRITLVSNQNGVAPDQMVKEIAGGLVVVENLETKLAFRPQELSLYPNPAKERLSLRGLRPKERFSVSDMNGREWQTGFADEHGSKNLSVSTWPAGLYFLLTESGQSRKLHIR